MAPAGSASTLAAASGERERDAHELGRRSAGSQRQPPGTRSGERPPQVDPRGPRSPGFVLDLQRLAGNRAVSSLIGPEPQPVQRLFGRGKKKPSTADELSAGFSALSGEKGSDQLKSLEPYGADIAVLADKGKLSAQIDKDFGGKEPLLREGLKTAVLLSSWSEEKITGRLAQINVKGLIDATQRKQVDKLVVELTKSAKKDKSATYKALYARCVQATGGLSDQYDAEYDAPKLENEDEAASALRKNVRNVSKISAMAFEMSYAEQLLKTREETLAAYDKQGKKPVETIVLGAGPVGMMAAIEAFLAGANVHVYEMRRSGPSRSNVLTLDQDTLAKLRRLGVYSALYGPDHTKGDTGVSNGVSVQYLEDMLRTRANQLGIKITYGYELESITAPDKEGGKSTVRLKKYVPTRPGPEKEIYDAMQSQKGGDTTKDVIDAQSDLLVGATGAGFTTGKALGLERERKQDEHGEDHRDFTGVGMFEPAQGDELRPSTDTIDGGPPRWINPIRTPKVNYILTQVSRENFVKFLDKKNESERDKYMEARGRLIGYKGKLRASSVFEITLNQAKQFANELAGGVVIGDEAATPHPKTGSGFNTGARSTGAIGGLVRGIGGGERKKAFGTFGQSMKSRTDLMMKKALSVFNSKTFAKPSKAPTPPPTVDSTGIGGQIAKSVGEGGGGGQRGYTPEDIGVTPENELEYQDAQDKTDSLFGMGPRARRGYEPEDIGVTPENELEYQDAQDKTDSLFGMGPRARRGYEPEDIGVTPEKEVDYRAIQDRIDSMFGIPTKRELVGEESGTK